MTEVEDVSARLLIGGGLYLGKGVGWDAYRYLYQRVYVENGLRIIRPDGLFLVVQTNAYVDGEYFCRYQLLLELLLPAGWRLIDERVWQRRRADHFQPPFSHVLVFAPSNGTARRNDFNGHNGWFQGVWRYPQAKGGPLNAWPPSMCRMIVEATTEPDDLIVDPFAGTGQLLAEATRMRRRAVGYEIDEALVPTLEGNGCLVIR